VVVLNHNLNRESDACSAQVHGRGADGLGSDVYLHTEVREGKKEGGVGAHLRLGRPLSITLAGGRTEEYEDLDEILARYADPYISNLKQVMRHRCATESLPRPQPERVCSCPLTTSGYIVLPNTFLTNIFCLHAPTRSNLNTWPVPACQQPYHARLVWGQQVMSPWCVGLR
jgi:hypothetical protein